MVDSKKEVLYLRDMAWKAESVTQVSRSGKFHGVDAVNEVWRYEEELSYHRTMSIYFMEKESAFTGAGCATSDCFFDTVHLSKKMLEKVRLPWRHDWMSLHAFTLRSI